MSKDSFVLYDDQYECFKLLPIEQRGLLIMAIFEFRLQGKTVQPLSEAAYMAYHIITGQINRDNKKYIDTCQRRKLYGSLGGKQKVANAILSKQKVANVADTDTDTDTDVEKEIYKEKETSKKTKNDGQSEEKRPSVIEQRFNQFWSAYPKKVGKMYAFNCFSKLKPTAELTQKMVDAIAEQKKSVKWTKNKGEFIPNPSTWLNQGRWEDELSPASDAESNASNSEQIIPKYSNFDADEAFLRAVERSYGKKD